MNEVFADNRPQSRDEEAADWCVRVAEAPLNADEQQAFDTWISTPDNAKAFEDALAIWQSAEVVAEKPELLHIRAEALENYRRANRQRWSRPSGGWFWRAGIAAAILLIVMTSFLALRNPMQLYETGIGERRIAILADGSRLSLDAATRIEVRLRDDRRELRLISGRAKFDVAKDPLRPFSVIAGDKLVIATGTSFSVEMLRSQVRIFLYEGHVAVLEKPAGATKPELVRLKAMAVADQALIPGSELITSIAKSTATLVAGDASRSLAWESGQLSFDDEPLLSAAERLNRYSQEKIVVADQATANLRVNGVFNAGDTAAFVEGVTALYPVHALRSNNRVTLKRN